MFSDRMVFVRAVHEARWMDDMELAVYDSWCALKLLQQLISTTEELPATCAMKKSCSIDAAAAGCGTRPRKYLHDFLEM